MTSYVNPTKSKWRQPEATNHSFDLSGLLAAHHKPIWSCPRTKNRLAQKVPRLRQELTYT